MNEDGVMDDSDIVKVLIVNEEGHYLAGTSTHWEFTDDRTRARVFNYVQDRVASILDLIKSTYGAVWIAVKLDPSEAYEFCDRCGARVVCQRAYFNGTQFLCAGCQNDRPAWPE